MATTKKKTTQKTEEEKVTETKKTEEKATGAKRTAKAKSASSGTTARKTRGTANRKAAQSTKEEIDSKAAVAATEAVSEQNAVAPQANVAVEQASAVDMTEAVAQEAASAAVPEEPAVTEMPKLQVNELETPEVSVVKKKILFVASEATPFIATGGLAEVIGSLSKALATDPGYDVRVMIPMYSDIKKEFRRQFRFIGNVFIPLSWRNQYCGIFQYEMNNVTFYFLDNEYYFKRPGCYGYYDDGERFAFFSRAVMEVIPFVNFYPDVMHCHDWQAALAAIYLKTIYCFRPEYQFIRSVFTIHNIEYQGQYSLDILEDLFGISNRYRNFVEFDGCINLMKGAIEVSEKFSTVSPRYAEEIMNPYYSHGLDQIVQRNRHKLCGILNGIDVDSYNPETDRSLFANFSIEHPENKKINKVELQKMLNLPVREDVPVIAMITRLVSHKGLDLVTEVIENLLHDDVQFIILGTGDYLYESYFSELSRRYPAKLNAIIAFNSDLARKIYGGADLFLMPSKSEPCGLSQMIACRYGTVPIVRETGGLYDSIKPEGNGGNGFTFADYNAYDMLYVIRSAIGCYYNKEYWPILMKRAMQSDFSWARSANEYKKMYEEVLG